MQYHISFWLHFLLFSLSKLGLKHQDLPVKLLSRLISLERLNLSGNRLQEFPRDLKLPLLSFLDMSDNQMEDVTTLEALTSVEELKMENNLYVTVREKGSTNESQQSKSDIDSLHIWAVVVLMDHSFFILLNYYKSNHFFFLTPTQQQTSSTINPKHVMPPKCCFPPGEWQPQADGFAS